MSSVDSVLGQIEAVYRARGADFHRLALARTGSSEQACDAVQEGFAHAIGARAAYRGSGSLEAWIARCVINAARDAQRRRTRRPETPAGLEGSEGAGAEALAGFDPCLRPVREAVRRLPPRQRDALFLRHYLGFGYAEIAQALEVEVGTVSATLAAARAALAEELQEVVR